MTSCRTRRNDRVVRVERRVKIGSAAQLEDALVQSEDSEHLNTSFVERLNLTIRQGSAYLRRCSPCHARGEDQLRRHVELLRCHYNFVRPHRALKFGRETRTPAMQAGVVSTRMTWSDIFTAPGLSRHLRVVVVRILVIVPHGHWHNCAANLLVAARTKAGGVINSKTAQAPVAGQSVTRPWRGRGARRGPQCGFQATGRSGREWPRRSGGPRDSASRRWRSHNLKPHLRETFTLSRDPRFLEKLTDVVGRDYLNPPQHALVLCVDEVRAKSQIQALDRTQPGLPLKKGRCGTMTHDYKRHGTTTLFAALDVLQGKVIGQCYARHRHQEFVRFLRRLDHEFPGQTP